MIAVLFWLVVVPVGGACVVVMIAAACGAYRGPDAW